MQDYTNPDVQSLLRSSLNITSLSDLLHFLSPRRLSDTYHDSLVYTNMLLITLFGNTERYVPAHMPHLINKAVLARIEQRIGRGAGVRSVQFFSGNRYGGLRPGSGGVQ